MPHELLIGERRRTVANALASLADFTVTTGADVESEWLVHNPHVSLYCLDAATSQAIFVEVAPEADIAAAPFIYLAQHENARRLFAMPYFSFLALAEGLETRRKQLILLFNMGRCGSTLLHHIFNQVPGGVSLSEPDGLIPYWSPQTRLPLAEASALIRASVNFQFRPQLFPQLEVAAIKFRGRSIGLLEQYYAAFPDATYLYLYRDVMSWASSMLRMFHRLIGSNPDDLLPLDDVMALLASSYGQTFDLATMGLGHLPTPISRAEAFAIGWLMSIEIYLKAVDAGVPFSAWRYEALNQRREETLTRLFARCGLPLTAVPRAMSGFGRDSQAGTLMASSEDRPGSPGGLSEELAEKVRAVVRCHPVIGDADFVVPGT